MLTRVLCENSKMTEKEIFMAAVRMEDRESRDDYLSEACGEDASLRDRIDALLAAKEREDSLLDHPPARFAPTVDTAGNWDEVDQQIGPYKLREKLGEGGFGVVYVAEQAKPIRRKVALKVVKPGMDSKEVVARFEAERQALALMDHPNIARVLDAGVTAQGRPFFVMELVHGVPITEFCDKNNLPTNKRLELFRDVCRAVQHAHQKGVIHRDLKPSNVMVTLRDGEPIPKVIDFGVAKALSQQLTEKTVYTRYGQVIGTPQYMSPEQAEMNELGIDTRSDIYSLGVLLYELLTGRPPIETDRLVASGYAEMIRLICEDEPLRPSAKVSTLGQQATVIADARQTDPVSLSRSLSGELDWIVMKALDKNRERRYETANQFAADIQCFLANEPVQACPPTLAYRLSKTVRRNRRLVAAATTFVVLLCLGLIGTSIGMLQASGQAQRAQAAQVEAESAQEKEANARRETEQQKEALAAKNLELAKAKAKAEEATKLAEQRAKEVHVSLYGANMLAAGYARLETAGLGVVKALTAPWVPNSEHLEDVRGWEWYYLTSLMHQADRTIPKSPENKGQRGFWTDDGMRLGIIEADGSFILRDGETDANIASLPAESGPYLNWEVSPENDRLAAAHSDGTVKIWDLSTGQVSYTLDGFEHDVQIISWSPNGERIATVDTDLAGPLHRIHMCQIKIWDLTENLPVLTIDATGSHLSSQDKIAWSPDGAMLANGGRWNFVAGLQVWDTSNGNPISRFRLDTRDWENNIFAIAWSPDGTRVAQTGPDSVVLIRDVESGEVLHELEGHDAYVELLSWSKDSKYLASGSWDKTIRVWDAETGGLEGILRGHESWVNNMLNWDPAGTHLVSTDSNQTVKLWSFHRGGLPSDTRGANSSLAGSEHAGKIFQGWSPKGDRFTTLDVSDIANRVLQVWDTESQQLIASIEKEGSSAMGAWSPDGSYLAIPVGPSTIKICDGQTVQTIKTVAIKQRSKKLAWSPDGKFIAYKNDDTIRIIDWQSENEVTSLTHQFKDAVTYVWNYAASDRNLLATWSRDDGCVRVWDIESGQVIDSVTGVGSSYCFLAWDPTGTRLACSTRSGFRTWTWDGKTFTEDLNVDGHSNVVGWLSWSPDGNRIATGSQDGNAKIWNSRTGQQLLTLGGHTTTFVMTFWHPDGQRLVTSANPDVGFQQPAEIYLWDARKGYAAAQQVPDLNAGNSR